MDTRETPQVEPPNAPVSGAGARAHGRDDDARELPGDSILGDDAVQITRGLAIAAEPSAIWPWLVTMAHGLLAPDSRAPEREFSVLLSQPPRALVLGALYDCERRQHLPFRSPRSSEYWHATWALVLEPQAKGATRLYVRSRVIATEASKRWSALWLHPFNDYMDRAELAELRRRAEHEESPVRHEAGT